ncbi:MAG: putative rane protein [Methanofollis sp.]|nr:putative rane protein [Methanofollis sp.]
MDGYVDLGAMHQMIWGPGWIGTGIFWIFQLVIGYFVYRDAKERGMSSALWFILAIIPVIGWLFLAIYVIIRETGQSGDRGKSAGVILDERYARGELSTEDYRQMKEELGK